MVIGEKEGRYILGLSLDGGILCLWRKKKSLCKPKISQQLQLVSSLTTIPWWFSSSLMHTSSISSLVSKSIKGNNYKHDQSREGDWESGCWRFLMERTEIPEMDDGAPYPKSVYKTWRRARHYSFIKKVTCLKILILCLLWARCSTRYRINDNETDTPAALKDLILVEGDN